MSHQSSRVANWMNCIQQTHRWEPSHATGTDTLPAHSLHGSPPARCGDHTALPFLAHLAPPAACPLAPSLLQGWRGHRQRREVSLMGDVKGWGAQLEPPSLRGEAPPAGRSPRVPPGDIKAFGNHARNRKLSARLGENLLKRRRPSLQGGIRDDSCF